MPTHVIMFQSRFADLVKSGAKRQTIRPERKRAIAVGDTLDLRAWSGLPYRTPQIRLVTAICTRIIPVRIYPLGISLDRRPLMGEAAQMFAQLDGFKDEADMLRWFEAMHGVHFEGLVYLW